MKVRRWVSIGILSTSSWLLVAGSAPASADRNAPDGVISVACVDWFLTGGHREHIHVEMHLEDEAGDPVVGALVVFQASYDTHDGTGPFVYQTNTSTTLDDAGKNKGAGCVDPTGSGVTRWFCCTGAGKWNGEIPGKRACPAGFFSAEVLSVTPPDGSNLVWDGVTPPNGREFSPTHE